MLRRLARPLWYLGRSPAAEETATKALRVLEQLSPGADLGWTYSELSRLRMNAGRNDAAIALGEQAVALAERLRDPGLLADALNAVGCAKVNNDDRSGRADFERSLDVARGQPRRASRLGLRQSGRDGDRRISAGPR